MEKYPRTLLDAEFTVAYDSQGMMVERKKYIIMIMSSCVLGFRKAKVYFVLDMWKKI